MPLRQSGGSSPTAQAYPHGMRIPFGGDPFRSPASRRLNGATDDNRASIMRYSVNSYYIQTELFVNAFKMSKWIFMQINKQARIL